MKNVRPEQLKICIFMPCDQYGDLVNNLLSITVEYDIDSIFYTDERDNKVDESIIRKEISKYFDVNVTSVHIDDCDYVGVWIVYQLPTT